MQRTEICDISRESSWSFTFSMKMFTLFLVPNSVKDKLRPVDRGSFQYCLILHTACIFTQIIPNLS